MWNLVTDPTIPLETKKKPTQKLGTSQRISYRKLVADLRFRHLSIGTGVTEWIEVSEVTEVTEETKMTEKTEEDEGTGATEWIEVTEVTGVTEVTEVNEVTD